MVPKFSTTACCIISLLCLAIATHAAPVVMPQNPPESQLLEVAMPRILVAEFTYLTTRAGYHYSFLLPDGTGREEDGLIVDPSSPEAYAKSDRNHDPDAPRNSKSRKLSPKSLQSLAG